MMPTITVKRNRSRAVPPNRYNDSTATSVVPDVMSVRPSVSVTAPLTAASIVPPHRLQPLADAVEDHDRVVDRVARHREQSGDHVEVEVVSGQAQHRDGDDEVVNGCDGGAGGEARRKRSARYAVMPGQGAGHRVRALSLKVPPIVGPIVVVPTIRDAGRLRCGERRFDVPHAPIVAVGRISRRGYANLDRAIRGGP
jgi:hypothetical protein